MDTLTILSPPEPIPVHVTRYLCPYCRRGRATLRATKLHMPKCWKNPALRGCKTCIFFESPGWGSRKPKPGVQPPARCKAGFSIATKGPVTNCRKWSPL